MQRKAHQRASLCFREKEAIFCFVLRLMRGSFLMPVMSGEWCWRTNFTLSHFSQSAWKGDLYFFFFADGDLSKCSESTIYTQRGHGDKRAIRVPYLRDYCIYFVHSMTPCILWLSDRYQWRSIADSLKMVACENIIIGKFKMREIALPARDCGR